MEKNVTKVIAPICYIKIKTKEVHTLCLEMKNHKNDQYDNFIEIIRMRGNFSSS